MRIVYISKKEAAKILYKTRGKFFKVVFRKRTDNTIRSLVGRTGVKKGTKGIGLSYNPDVYKLMVVYDIKKQGYRMVPLDNILYVKFKKTIFRCSQLQGGG